MITTWGPREIRLKEKYKHLPGIGVRWLELPEDNGLDMPAGNYFYIDDIEAAAETWNSDELRMFALCLRWVRDE